LIFSYWKTSDKPKWLAAWENCVREPRVGPCKCFTGLQITMHKWFFWDNISLFLHQTLSSDYSLDSSWKANSNDWSLGSVWWRNKDFRYSSSLDIWGPGFISSALICCYLSNIINGVCLVTLKLRMYSKGKKTCHL